jgi:hypothetical protein
MSLLLIRNQEDLSGLLVERFYLKLKDAVSSELSENWKVGVNFIIDDMISDVELNDSPDLAREEIWLQFFDNVCERMKIPEDWLQDIDRLSERELDWLLVDVLKEYQQKSPTLESRVRPERSGVSSLSQLEGLSVFLVHQFYLKLKRALLVELISNWRGIWTFDISEIRKSFRADNDDVEFPDDDEIEEDDEDDEPDWDKFLGVMRRRMEVQYASLEDYPLAFIDFMFLAMEAIEELQEEEESSTLES